jgi:hypothetical protein
MGQKVCTWRSRRAKAPQPRPSNCANVRAERSNCPSCAVNQSIKSESEPKCMIVNDALMSDFTINPPTSQMEPTVWRITCLSLPRVQPCPLTLTPSRSLKQFASTTPLSITSTFSTGKRFGSFRMHCLRRSSPT